MRGSPYTLAFAAVLGSVCALVLTGAGAFTAPYRKANERAEEMRAILDALRVAHEPGLGSEGLAEVFARDVNAEDRGSLRVYRHRTQGAVAVPFAGPGMWGRIEGFLALESDMTTIRGITFHRQEETPGLGGEIASASFRRRFEGKSIAEGDGSANIRILRGGGAAERNEVDGITGATVTCEKVQAMLNEAIARVAKARVPHAR